MDKKRKRPVDSQENLVQILEFLPVAVAVADLEGNILFINRAFEQTFGYAHAETPTMLDWCQQVCPDPAYCETVIETWKDDITASKSSKQASPLRIRRIITRDKRELEVELSVKAVQNQLVIVFNDATEEVKQLARFPSENPNPVLRIRQDGVVLYANRAGDNVLRAWKYKVGEVVPDAQRDLVVTTLDSNKDHTIEIEVDQRSFSLTFVPVTEYNYVNVYGLDITERVRSEAEWRRAEQALREKTEEIEKFFSSALDLLCIANTDGYFERLNLEWEKVLGYRQEELEGQRFMDFVHPDDVEATLEAVSQLDAQNEILNFTNRYRCKDGSYRWIEWRSCPMGRKIYAAARDVTEHQQAANTLAQERLLLRTVIDNLPDAIYAKDLQARKTLANRTDLNNIGVTSEDEVLGKTDYELFPHDVAARFNADDHQVLRTGQPILNREEVLVNRKGRRIWQLTSKLPLKDPDGQVIGLVGIGRDITERVRAEKERKQAEQALRDSETRYRELVERMSSAVVVYRALPGGEDFIFVDFNQAGERIEQIQREDLIGKRVTDIFPSVKAFGLFDVFKQVWETGEPAYHPITFYEDARIAGWRENYIYRLPTGEIVAIYEDVTKRKQAEQALREQFEEIERFSHLAIGRERRMIELKQQINELSHALGHPLPYDTLHLESDVAEEEQAQEEIAPLTPPPDEEQAPDLIDLISIDQMQRLLDSFCAAVGVAAAIIDLEGNVLVGAHWQRLCTDYHRSNDRTCTRCIESDTILARQLQEGEQYSIYQCRNGLTDAASPIIIEGHHIANAFVGQFLLEPPDKAFFRRQTKEYGFDETAYFEALAEVPIVPREKLPSILDFLTNSAELVATTGMERLREKEIELTIRQQREAAMNLAQDAIKARGALLESEARFRKLSENSLSGIYIIRNNCFSYVNPAFAEIFGYTPGEIMREIKPLDIVHPDDRALVAKNMQMRLDGEIEVSHYTVRGLRKNGESLYYEALGRRIDYGGQSAIMGNILDITERVRSERQREELLAQVREQIQRVQQIINTVPEGMLLLDANFCVLQCNPPAEAYLLILADIGTPATGNILLRLGEYPTAEFLTSPPYGLWHEVTAKGHYFQVIARAIETGPTMGGWVLVIHDVTEAREVEYRTQRQERLAAVGQLAAGIAHDFNNIIATITLYSQMSLRLPDLPPKLTERLSIITEQSRRASDLINQILDFSRSAVLDRHPLDLVPLVKEQVKLWERTLPENIRIHFNYSPDVYTINADPTRIQQVLMNLVVNARDAMPEGGTLRINLEWLQFATRRDVPLPDLDAGMWVRLTVSDTGTGISPEVLPRIFDPFFTTKEPGKGTGLGLTQVFNIVTSHDGVIDVQSQPGGGAAFIIYIPALPPSEPFTSPLLDSDLPLGHGETILVVEDNAATRAAVVSSLELLNYNVLEAANGNEALDLFGQHRDEITLVLSDWVMPEMGGKMLTQALQARVADVRVVVMSGHPLEAEGDIQRETGVLDWIQKPPSLEKLAETLANALNNAD